MSSQQNKNDQNLRDQKNVKKRRSKETNSNEKEYNVKREQTIQRRIQNPKHLSSKQRRSQNPNYLSSGTSSRVGTRIDNASRYGSKDGSKDDKLSKPLGKTRPPIKKLSTEYKKTQAIKKGASPAKRDRTPPRAATRTTLIPTEELRDDQANLPVNTLPPFLLDRFPAYPMTPFYIPKYQVVNDIPLPIHRNMNGVIEDLLRCFNCGSSAHTVKECTVSPVNRDIVRTNIEWMERHARLGYARGSAQRNTYNGRYFTKQAELTEDVSNPAGVPEKSQKREAYPKVATNTTTPKPKLTAGAHKGPAGADISEPKRTGPPELAVWMNIEDITESRRNNKKWEEPRKGVSKTAPRSSRGEKPISRKPKPRSAEKAIQTKRGQPDKKYGKSGVPDQNTREPKGSRQSPPDTRNRQTPSARRMQVSDRQESSTRSILKSQGRQAHSDRLRRSDMKSDRPLRKSQDGKSRPSGLSHHPGRLQRNMVNHGVSDMVDNKEKNKYDRPQNFERTGQTPKKSRPSTRRDTKSDRPIPSRRTPKKYGHRRPDKVEGPSVSGRPPPQSGRKSHSEPRSMQSVMKNPSKRASRQMTRPMRQRSTMQNALLKKPPKNSDSQNVSPRDG